MAFARITYLLYIHLVTLFRSPFCCATTLWNLLVSYVVIIPLEALSGVPCVLLILRVNIFAGVTCVLYIHLMASAGVTCVLYIHLVIFAEVTCVVLYI